MTKLFPHLAISLSTLLTACATGGVSSETYMLKNGFANVERAPAQKRPAPEPRRAQGMGEIMARSYQQNEYREEASALMQTLRAEEPDNYIQLRIDWEPEFRYLVLFKNDPAETLARYTQNPIFHATGGRYTKAELQSHMDAVWTRLAAQKAVTSGSLDLVAGKAELETGLTREEFDAIPELTDLIEDKKVELVFRDPLSPPEAIDPNLAPHIRYLSRADQFNGMVQTSLTTGRIVLRDGCFFLDGNSGQDPLVRFHKEVGIGFDDEGYIVIINRIWPSGPNRKTARVGELAGWGDGIRKVTDKAIIAPLQAACGKYPVVRIGTPSSRYGEQR